jgi:hemoglobin
VYGLSGAGSGKAAGNDRTGKQENPMSTAAEPEPTIYDQIGGEPALTVVVDDFYARVVADQRLSGFFAGTNMDRLKGRQVEFFAAALGGPVPYTGASMRDAHRGRGIRKEDFDRVVNHLVASLVAVGVPERTVAEIVAAVAPLAGEIVSSSAD